MNRMSAGKAIFTLLIFSPLALFPVSGHSALLSSQTILSRGRGAGAENLVAAKLREEGIPPDHARRVTKFLSLPEIERLVQKDANLCLRGKGSSPLETNETVAIILTLIMIATMVGFVEQTR